MGSILGKTIEQIADQVGFANAKTLNKAFQRRFRLTPASTQENISSNISCAARRLAFAEGFRRLYFFVGRSTHAWLLSRR